MTHNDRGVLGTVVSDLLKDMKAPLEPVAQPLGKPLGQSSGSFLQTMEQAAKQGALEQQAHKAGLAKFSEIVVAAQAQAQKKTEYNRQASLKTTVGSTGRREDSALMGMMRRLMHGQDEMERIMNEALSGKQYDMSDVMAMQAKIYYYTQELDLSAKVVDKGSSGIKQTLSTQV